jgi:hypothetical protein
MNKSAVFQGESPQSTAIKKRARPDGIPSSGTLKPASEAESSLWELSRAIEVGLSGLESLAKDLEAMQVADKSRIDECRMKLKGVCASMRLSEGRPTNVVAISTPYPEARSSGDRSMSRGVCSASQGGDAC